MQPGFHASGEEHCNKTTIPPRSRQAALDWGFAGSKSNQEGKEWTDVFIGSRGQVIGTCKPCAFSVKQGFILGLICPFCHLCEAGEKKRRKKSSRHIASDMIHSASSDEASIADSMQQVCQTSCLCLPMVPSNVRIASSCADKVEFHGFTTEF